MRGDVAFLARDRLRVAYIGCGGALLRVRRGQVAVLQMSELRVSTL